MPGERGGARQRGRRRRLDCDTRGGNLKARRVRGLIRGWLLLCGALVCGAAPALGQAGGGPGAAPQILTSDLAREQALERERHTVSFVFIDTDRIAQVRINGVDVPIEPSDTVMITREFTFTQYQTLIVVEAADEAGNVRSKQFRVVVPHLERSTVAIPRKPRPFNWNQVFRYTSYTLAGLLAAGSVLELRDAYELNQEAEDLAFVDPEQSEEAETSRDEAVQTAGVYAAASLGFAALALYVFDNDPLPPDVAAGPSTLVVPGMARRDGRWSPRITVLHRW